jgi:hypothetical protein
VVGQDVPVLPGLHHCLPSVDERGPLRQQGR